MSKDNEIKECSQYENLIDTKNKTGTASLADLLDDDSRKELVAETEDAEWKKYWKGMPDYVQEDNPTYKTLYVHFRCEEDYQEFAKLIDQKLTNKTKSIWHPKLDRTKNSFLRWIEEDVSESDE